MPPENPEKAKPVLEGWATTPGWQLPCSTPAKTAAGCEPLKQVARAARVPLIAVNDVLYHEPEQRDLQDVVTCIREHVTLR